MAKAKTTKKQETNTEQMDTPLPFMPVIEDNKPENKKVETEEKQIQNKEVEAKKPPKKKVKKKNSNYFAKVSDFLHF